ncbi:MAG: hypothetical protein ACTSYT_05445 [Candidatus Asgardarchaeia archaeon]
MPRKKTPSEREKRKAGSLSAPISKLSWDVSMLRCINISHALKRRMGWGSVRPRTSI